LSGARLKTKDAAKDEPVEAKPASEAAVPSVKKGGIKRREPDKGVFE